MKDIRYKFSILLIATLLLTSTALTLASISLVKASNPADINNDGIVDIQDIAYIGYVWGSYPSQSGGRWHEVDPVSGLEYGPLCDLNHDEMIDIVDIAIAAMSFS
jgi:hypothetical protein